MDRADQPGAPARLDGVPRVEALSSPIEALSVRGLGARGLGACGQRAPFARAERPLATGDVPAPGDTEEEDRP